MGNPAADKLVKDYLRLVTAEQLQARVTPKQATPFFVDKLTRLAEHLQRSLGNAKSNIERFIAARDQVYFKTAFFSGDRSVDLGQVKTPEILRFPNDDGYLLNHTWGKTLRDGRQIGINMTTSYLFRPTTTDNGVRDAPLSSATAEARLKLYVKQMKANEGETLHGFRSGCAITLALTGADLSEIMEHVGWARRHCTIYNWLRS